MNSGDQSTVKDELRSDARNLGDAARERVASVVDGSKGTATRQVKSAVSALQTAERELDADSPEWLRSALRQGTQALQRMADSVEGKSSRELMDDVQRMARNNPVMFWGLCAAAGFAAVRVMKAGADNSQTGSSRWDSRNSSWDDSNRHVSLRSSTKEEPALNSEYRDQAGYGRASMPAGADALAKPQTETESW